jgi:hypothetical protein
MLIERGELQLSPELYAEMMAAPDDSVRTQIYRRHKIPQEEPKARWLVPIVVSRKDIPKQFRDKLIEQDGITILPHWRMIVCSNDTLQWVLDIGKRGLLLTADGTVMSGQPVT